MSDELPPGWSRALLRELVGPNGLMADGDWVESKDQDPNGDVRLTQLADIGDGRFLDKSNRFLTSDKAKQLNCTILQSRDVLISRLGEPLGKTCLFPELDQKCVTVVDVHVVRPRSTDVTREWLMHTLNSAPVRRKIDSMSSGTTRKRITGQRLRDLEVPVPPALEQTRIASKIDELFSRIDEGERALERVSILVERYRQSVLKAAVTGELTREWREQRKASGHLVESGQALLTRILSARREAWEEAELAKMQAKGITPKNDSWKKKYIEPAKLNATDLPRLPKDWVWVSFEQLVWLSQNGVSKRSGETGRAVNVLRLADVADGQIVGGDPRKIRLTDEEVERYRLLQGDLICVRVNGSRGLTGRLIPVESSDEWAYCDHFIRFRPVPELVPYRYLDLCFDAGITRNAVESSMVTTAGQNTVSQSNLFQVPVPLPPLEEQRVLLSEVELRLSQAFGQARDVLAAKYASGALRRAVLRVAFAGQLVSQSSTDEPASVLLERIAAGYAESKTVAPNRGRKPKTPA